MNQSVFGWSFPLMIPDGRREFHEGIEVLGGADRRCPEAGAFRPAHDQYADGHGARDELTVLGAMSKGGGLASPERFIGSGDAAAEAAGAGTGV